MPNPLDAQFSLMFIWKAMGYGQINGIDGESENMHDYSLPCP